MKIVKKLTENCHFNIPEKLLYIAWAWFRTGLRTLVPSVLNSLINDHLITVDSSYICYLKARIISLSKCMH